MDFQRIAIISSIAIVLYMLVGNWVQFKENHTETKSTELLPANESIYEEDIFSQSAGEVPSVSYENKESTPQKATSKKSLISVSTDNFNIKINPLGGDIVYADLKKHAADLKNPEEGNFVLLNNTNDMHYVANSGLIGKNGTDKSNTDRPLFSSNQYSYQMQANKDLIVDLALPEKDGITITKRFTFFHNDYLIHVEYLIENNSEKPWEGFFYGQLKRDNSQDPSAKKNKSMGLSPFLGIATSTTEDRFKKIKFSDLDDESEKFTKEGGWISILQHYFLAAWIPDQNKTNNYTALKTDSGLYIARFTQPKTIVPPKQIKTIKSSIYIGPKDQYRLEKISEGLDLSVDYGILWWIAQPLFALLHFFALGELHVFGKTFSIGSGLGNWGFSIILLTICVKLIFYKLSAASYRSMANMRKVQPKLEALKARYGDDRQKMSQELMALYKKEKINPLGGCLPILVQMPVFLSLYWVLLESVELRHAPFIGYIQDLSAMDPYFILPLLMGATMFVQQQLNPTPPDPIQAKVMKFLPVIFTFFFLFFPAGLVLYWVVNSLLSILQQWWITRAIEKASS